MGQFLSSLPEEGIVYFGDTARVPYGSKSKATVIRFGRETLHFLLQFNPKLIVVACNTISALALPVLRKESKVPVIGVLEPAVTKALKITKNNRIGVIGTAATIKSKAYPELIHQHRPKVSVLVRACPLFVPLVEENWLKDKVTERIAHFYLKKLEKKGIDTLILGCTHYPLLKNVIGKEMGKKVSLVDSAKEVLSESRRFLEERGVLQRPTTSLRHRFFFSDEVPNFRKISKQFLRRSFTARVVQINERTS